MANRRGDSPELRHMDYKKIKRVTETRRLILLTTRATGSFPWTKRALNTAATRISSACWR